MFPHSLRTLAADGFRRSLWGYILVAIFLGGWGAWFLRARVAVYAVTEAARLEIAQAAHPIAAPVAGRVALTHLVVGQEVQAGAVLVELEADAQRLELEEAQARHAAFATQLSALRKEIAAEEEARREEGQAAQRALEEARARHHEAEVAAQAAEEEAALFTRLQARDLAAQLDLLRSKAEARKRRAAADTLRLAVGRLEGEQRTRERERRVRLERLTREITRLEGELATAAATNARLAHAIEQRRIRAPIGGRLGEVANLRIGAVVHEGDILGAVVPPGDLRVVAQFLPSTALGRLRPGQPARVRLEGFPWAQFGSLAATVARVANEARDGRIRVELSLQRDPASPIPLQHGLPGTVEVEVERAAPATLVLRAVGKRLGAPTGALGAEDGGGVTR